MQKSTLKFRQLTFGSKEQQETVRLRDEILRKPLGLAFTKEELAQEKNQLHLAAYHENELVACLLLVEQNERMKMRQVAVAEAWQRQGIGRQLVLFSEKIMLEKGIHEMYFHARESAVPFYNSMDYDCYGERFEEVGVPHFKMRKQF